MKTSIKYLLMGASLLVTLPQLTACSDDDAVDPYDLNYVYIYSPNQADNNLEYKANGTFITAIEEQCVVNPVRCTKPAPSDLTVELSIDGSLVDSYNQAHGTSYTLLKGAKLENSSLTIKKGEYASEQSLRVVYTDMSEFQNGTENYILPIAISKLTGSGALVSETTGQLYLTFTSIYRANLVSFDAMSTDMTLYFKSSGYTEEVESFSLGQLISSWSADEEIRVNLAIDNNQIDILNAQNGTNYQPLPVPVELKQRSYTISKGSAASEQAIEILFSEGIQNLPHVAASYAVPVVIESVEGTGAAKDAEYQVYYAIIDCVELPFATSSRRASGTLMPVDYDNWTVTVNGSETYDYEGYIYEWIWLFDNYEVYYWNNNEPMVVDFGSEKKLSSVEFLFSYGSDYSYDGMKIETSVDGENYEYGTVALNRSSKQVLNISNPRPVRYLRMTPSTSSWGYPTGINLYVAE